MYQHIKTGTQTDTDRHRQRSDTQKEDTNTNRIIETIIRTQKDSS